MRMTEIPFNRVALAGRELDYIAEVIRARKFSGGGRFSELCKAWIRNRLGSGEVRLTHSCTGALELAAILARVGTGDEVIMPSFTFPSTANAVVQRGAVPVFVDIRPDTLNLDETLIEGAVTSRTKAIIVVHYAGICAEMDAITMIARRYGLIVIEDAAHAMLSTYRGRMAGSLGDFGCFSFHETKNVIAGEGGAIVFQDPALAEMAAVIAGKGTNREAFQKGQVASYTWTDCGSSFNMNELIAGFLYAQLEAADRFTSERHVRWLQYHDGLADLEAAGLVRRPIVPAHCAHNSHLYRLILRDQGVRDCIIRGLASDGISAPFHFIPLHSSPAGRRFGRAHGALDITDRTSASLIRLPLHAGMSSTTIDIVVERLHVHLGQTF